jgi:hypothetical protein
MQPDPSSLDTEAYARVLQVYVDDFGRVDYEALKTAPDDLEAFLRSAADLESAAYTAWTEAAQIAFWINVYNACTLKVIIDHYPIRRSGLRGLAYPGNSIRQISGVWDRITFLILGKGKTLDDIEHTVLRREFDEPGIHMALVCAARSCPFLRREPFIGTRLAEQLADQARRFLSSPRNFSIDFERRIVFLSSIFKWFRKDFVSRFGPDNILPGFKREESAVLAFISRFIPESGSRFLRAGNYRVKYLDYDWSLNDRRVP